MARIVCSMGSELFGLPDWWCIVSIGMISFFLLLLIIAYLKGRSLHKRSIRTTGIKGIVCSNCGLIMTRRLDECPRCRAVFEEDIYRCPECNGIIDRGDRSCPRCDIALMDIEDVDERSRGKKEKIDPDLIKLRNKGGRYGAIECRHCAKTIDAHSMICPECGKEP